MSPRDRLDDLLRDTGLRFDVRDGEAGPCAGLRMQGTASEAVAIRIWLRGSICELVADDVLRDSRLENDLARLNDVNAEWAIGRVLSMPGQRCRLSIGLPLLAERPMGECMRDAIGHLAEAAAALRRHAAPLPFMSAIPHARSNSALLRSLDDAGLAFRADERGRAVRVACALEDTFERYDVELAWTDEGLLVCHASMDWPLGLPIRPMSQRDVNALTARLPLGVAIAGRDSRRIGFVLGLMPDWTPPSAAVLRYVVSACGSALSLIREEASAR